MIHNFLQLIPKAYAVQTDFPGDPQNLGDYVNLALPEIIKVIGAAALLVVIFAGYVYMTSQGDETKITLAKELIIGVITGVLLLFLIGILRTQIGF